MIQDPGDFNVDRPNPREVLLRLGKHQVQVLGGDIIRRARNEN
jgi:hypothetical protein